MKENGEERGNQMKKKMMSGDEKKSLMVAVFSLLFSLPALIGS